MSNPNPAAAALRLPRWLLGLGLLALTAYAAFLAYNFSPVAAGADSSGYLNSARLLASGQLAMELRTPPEFGPQAALFRQQFQPHGFAPFEGRPKLSPTYAVGFPLHLALVSKIFGWTLGPIVVGIGGALASVLLCYAVARQLDIEPILAATGAVLLGAYPVLIYMSLQPLSDGLATAWCLAAVSAALAARKNAVWAIACGAALAMAVLVRATNALLLPTLLLLLGWDVRRLALAALGGIPGALWLGYYNHALYGGVFQSGYVNISDAFGWTYGPPTMLHFVKWLALLLPAVVFPLAGIPLIRPDAPSRTRWALLAWFGAFFLLYAFYEISHEVWWCLRFILPGTPALVLAALLGWQRVAKPRWVRVIGSAALVIWALALGWYWPRTFHILLTKHYEQAYADATAAALTRFPAGSLVLAGHHSGSLYFYTSFSVLRWELVNPTEFERYRDLAQKAGRSICAILYDSEEREALQDHCRGDWKRVDSVQNVSLWRLEPPSPARP